VARGELGEPVRGLVEARGQNKAAGFHDERVVEACDEARGPTWIVRDVVVGIEDDLPSGDGQPSVPRTGVTSDSLHDIARTGIARQRLCVLAALAVVDDDDLERLVLQLRA
jgi:hypothetical protein